MKKKAKTKEMTVDVAEKEYQADLSRGWQEDEVLKPGRHKFRRGGFLARHGLKPERATSGVKVRISINLDLDILSYFKQRAAKPHAAPYQTQINHELREVMEREVMEKDKALATLPSPAEVLLSDQRFIEAVAQRVKAHRPLTRKHGRRAA